MRNQSRLRAYCWKPLVAACTLGLLCVAAGCGGSSPSSAVVAAEPAVANSGDPDEVAAAQGQLIQYQWPPERPSTQSNLTKSVSKLVGQTVMDVADALLSAANDASYSDVSFYGAPNGFVMATRLEATRPDGKPLLGMSRYAVPLTGLNSLDGAVSELSGNLGQGRYRYIAFVVTDQPIEYAQERLTAEGANALLDAGATNIGGWAGAQPFTAKHKLIALVYEFMASGEPVDKIELIRPSRLGAMDHLQAAGFINSISKTVAATSP